MRSPSRIRKDIVNFIADHVLWYHPRFWLELRGPIGGYFTWRVADGGPLLLVAGGSGIVPLMAMIRHRAAQGSNVPTRPLYSSRAFDEIIYRDALARLAAADPTLTVTHTLTRRQPPPWYTSCISPLLVPGAIALTTCRLGCDLR
jgi:NAD(P)H-flavin reductase